MTSRWVFFSTHKQRCKDKHTSRQTIRFPTPRRRGRQKLIDEKRKYALINRLKIRKSECNIGINYKANTKSSKCSDRCMVCDRRKTKCHLWITAATVKDKGNHGGVLLSTRSEEYLVVCTTSPSQKRLPPRRGRTQVFVHSGGLTDTHVCAQTLIKL